MPSKETEPKDIWAQLRKPFPKEVVGKLPRGGIQLDFVGHAAVTDRLLTVDPQWSWEPLAVNEHGLPVLDDKNGLWIKLTIGGVTRIGYGDGPDNKQRIGDAIRNAAMRFGVALDLWTKDELESNLEHPENKNKVTPPHIDKETGEILSDHVTPAQIKLIFALIKEKGLAVDKEAAQAWIYLQSDVESVNDLTKKQASKLIEHLQELAAKDDELAVPFD